MLVRHNRPLCAAALLRATELAVLAVQTLSEDTPETDARRCLNQNPLLKAQRWLHGRREVRTALQQIRSLPVAERQELHRAFAHDVKLFDDPRQKHFCFESGKLPEHVFKPGAAFMEALYANVLCETGIKIVSPTPGEPSVHVDRHTLEDAIKTENRQFVGCPACLISRLPGIIRVEDRPHSLNDCDHFFPQSVFPVFALHPDNLLLVCGHCNSRIKGDKSPTALMTVKAQVDFDKLWLPYRSQGIDHIRLEFAVAGCELQVKVSPDAAAKDAQVCWELHNKLYAVRARWEDLVREQFEVLLNDFPLLSLELNRPEVTSEPAPLSTARGWLDDQVRNHAGERLAGSHILRRFFTWLRDEKLASVQAAVGEARDPATLP